MGEPLLTPRLEAYEAAARIYGYPVSEHGRLIRGAITLHRLVHKIDKIDWFAELGQAFRSVRAIPEEAFFDGD